MRRILQFIVRLLAKRTIARYKPIVIGITGSVGKTTAKEAVYAVLRERFSVRKSESNYNNEIGIPLSVVGVSPITTTSFGERLRLLSDLFGAAWRAYGFSKQKNYPEVLVLELGADRPGDIAYLCDIVKPQIGVITAVGDVPVHVEYYASPKAVAQEKAKLVRSLPKDGLAILNIDDETVRDIGEHLKVPIKSFGFVEGADVTASDVSYFIDDEEDGVVHDANEVCTIGGLSFKLHSGNSFIPARLNGMIAQHQLYGLLAATVVGLHLKLNLVDISRSFERMAFPKGRMRLLYGVQQTVIIDDTYNAAPLSTQAALESLNDFAKALKKADRKIRRKVAILGDMRELGKFEEQAHRRIGEIAGQQANVVIAVGAASMFIAEAAKDVLSDKRVIHFLDVSSALEAIPQIIKNGDLILVKGSQGSRMEKIIKTIMARPEQARDLLVRQSDFWLKK